MSEVKLDPRILQVKQSKTERQMKHLRLPRTINQICQALARSASEFKKDTNASVVPHNPPCSHGVVGPEALPMHPQKTIRPVAPGPLSVLAHRHPKRQSANGPVVAHVWV